MQLPDVLYSEGHTDGLHHCGLCVYELDLLELDGRQKCPLKDINL